jgi:hypothetical protein
VEDWQGQSKPTGFVGRVWPPKVIEDLIGDVDKTEYAVRGCDVCNKVEDGFCTCGYNSWRDHWSGYWCTSLLLQRAGARGYGIFARKVIKDSIVVGEYTGRIKPVNTNEANEEDAYCVPISIGGCNTERESQAKATLDALHTGSILRFINHSCKPNARLQEFQCGLERRVVYVVAIGAIAINEELTINYGPKWLTGHCLCGNTDCKNPPSNPAELDAPMQNLSEDEAMDMDEDESLVEDVTNSAEDDIEVFTGKNCRRTFRYGCLGYRLSVFRPGVWRGF